MIINRQFARSALAALSLILACANSAFAQGVLLGDSLGVKIQIHRHLDTLKRAVDLTPTLVAQIGGGVGGPHYDFANISDALVLNSGEIVLATAGEIRFFDEKGAWLRSLGGKGARPGEFNGINQICSQPDGSLLVFDGPARRLTLFDKTGAVAWAVAFTPFVPACLSDGSVLGATSPTTIGAPPLRQDLERIVLADITVRYSRYSRYAMEQVPRFLGDVALVRAGVSGTRVRRGANIIVNAPMPFARAPHVSAGSGRICVADAMSYDVKSYDMQGKLFSVLRADRSPRPVTDDDRRRYVEQEVAMLSGQEREDRIREIETIGFQENYPPHSRVICDDAGRVWIQEYATPGSDTQVWHVFRSNGEHLGGVSLPSALWVMSVSQGRMITRNRDANGAIVAKIFSLGSR